MPVVSVLRDVLFTRLEWQIPKSKEEADALEKKFSDLCFQFGLELDDVEEVEGVIVYKIEVAANRYDLLCVEGLVSALRVFLGKECAPEYSISHSGVMMKHDTRKTSRVRPFVVSALLRNIVFTDEVYKSCIELQEKLHFTACRRRALVAIGTHDFDTVKPPFTYTTMKPEDILFKPLNCEKEMNGFEVLEHFGSKESHLRPYVDLLKKENGEPLDEFPIIIDSENNVLSLPPLINGDLTKLTKNCKNMLIECTATDRTRAIMVLNILCAMFGQYCTPKNSIDSVKVVDLETQKEEFFPQLDGRDLVIELKEVEKAIGVSLSVDEVAECCKKMMLCPEAISDPSQTKLRLRIPSVRADVLHPCDVYEDVAIAYGFDRLSPVTPPTSTQGAGLKINALADALRMEMAMCGYVEMLTSSLCAVGDNALRKDVGEPAEVANPKTQDFVQIRTHLMGSLLRCAAFNRKAPLPLQLFEVNDVARLDATHETGARNIRVVGLLYCAKQSGLEKVHGMVDRILMLLGSSRVSEDGSDTGYYQRAGDRDGFLPGRCACIYLRKSGDPGVPAIRTGVFGIIHPDVLQHFGVTFPCSYLEIELLPFL